MPNGELRKSLCSVYLMINVIKMIGFLNLSFAILDSRASLLCFTRFYGCPGHIIPSQGSDFKYYRFFKTSIMVNIRPAAPAFTLPARNSSASSVPRA